MNKLWLSAAVSLTLTLSACFPAENLNTTYSPESAKSILEGLTLPNTQTTSTQTSTTVERVPGVIENLLLWKITPPGENPKTSYMLGSVSQSFKAGFDIPEQVKELIKGTELYVTESDVLQLETALNFVQSVGADTEQNLQADLGEEDWKKLQEQIQKINPGLLPTLTNIKPWFLNFVLQAAQPSSGTAVSNALRSFAQTNDKTVGFLENITDVYTVLSQALTYEEELERLKTTLKQSAQERYDFFNTIFEAYNKNDLQTLVNQDQVLRETQPKYYDILVRSRTESWLLKLDPLFRSQALSVVVDIMTLVGPQGMFELLKANGYTVEQVLLENTPQPAPTVFPSVAPINTDSNSNPSSGNQSSTGTTLQRAAGRLENTLVWEVTHPTSGKISHFIGTVSQGLKTSYALPAKVTDIIAEAQRFVTESDATQIQTALTAVQSLGADANQNLEKDLSAEQWSALQTQVTLINPNLLPSLPQIRPWFLNFVLEAPQPLAVTSQTNLLRSQAEKAQTELAFLEQITDIYAVLSQTLTYEEEVARLKSNLTTTAAQRFEANNTLFDAYNAGDLSAMEKIKTEERQMQPKLYEVIVKSRTDSWVIKLEPFFENESLAVAVDVLSLIGEDGVLKQLEAKGYNVKASTL